MFWPCLVAFWRIPFLSFFIWKPFLPWYILWIGEVYPGVALYPDPERGPGIRCLHCLSMCRHPLFCGASETTVIWSVFHDCTLLKHAGRYILVESQFWETAFGQAVSYGLSKVGKPEMVLKNEQLTAMQLLRCEGSTLTTSTYIRWKPIAFRQRDKKYRSQMA